MIEQTCRNCGESWGASTLEPCPFCGFDTHNHNLKPARTAGPEPEPESKQKPKPKKRAKRRP